MVERAVKNRSAGMSIHENAANLMDAVKHIHHWFMVQDLMYLQRGGRISAATAAAGSVFHIRPILQIDSSGKLQMIRRAHGTNKAVNLLLEYYEENRAAASGDPVYVVDADAPEISEKVSEKLLTAHPELSIRRRSLSPIIGAHTGPGMAAIIHLGKENL